MKPRVLVIDDVRTFEEADYHARTAQDGMYQLEKKGPWAMLLLDHDLASYNDFRQEITGYDILCWLEKPENLKYVPDRIALITSNPVGRENMQRVIDSIHQKLGAI